MPPSSTAFPLVAVLVAVLIKAVIAARTPKV